MSTSCKRAPVLSRDHVQEQQHRESCTSSHGVTWDVNNPLPGEVEEKPITNTHLLYLLQERVKIREALSARVGTKVAVLWPDDDEFYRGTVTFCDLIQRVHHIEYEDGDFEKLKLEEESWYFTNKLNSGCPSLLDTSFCNLPLPGKIRFAPLRQCSSVRHVKKEATTDTTPSNVQCDSTFSS